MRVIKTSYTRHTTLLKLYCVFTESFIEFFVFEENNFYQIEKKSIFISTTVQN